MKPIRAIIVDDEPDAVAYLDDLLKGHPDVEVISRLTDAGHIISTVIDQQPDLLFLDIQMPGKDGIAIIRELRQLDQPVTVIFITAYDKYAIDALKHAAFDYLLKPVTPEELSQTLTRFKAGMIKKEQTTMLDRLIERMDISKKLRFNTRTGFIILNSNDIIYIESDRNYSTIFLTENRKEVITMNLGTIESLLPSSFRRISRFHIINTGFVAKIDRKKHLCILLVDGHNYELPVNHRNIRELEDLAM